MSSARLMLLDEELTESMRQHTQFRGGPSRVGDSIADFENQVGEDGCIDLPSPMVESNDSPMADFREFDSAQPLGVSTDNLGLLIFSGLQSMQSAQNGMGYGAARAAGIAAARGQGLLRGNSSQYNNPVHVRVNPAVQLKRSSSRDALNRTDLSESKFKRARPLESCAFLEPGMTFGGTQDVSPSATSMRESWDLRITVEETNFSKGYVCGTMYANGFNCSSPMEDMRSPVVTFWEGEIIDNFNHSFYTQKWGATKATDRNHWLKLTPFCKALRAEEGGNKANQEQPIDLGNQPFIYMRLKEKYFLNEEPGGNLTIAGFYYLCISRATGEIMGYYFDPNSTPYQEVKLQVIYEGSNGFISAGGDLI